MNRAFRVFALACACSLVTIGDAGDTEEQEGRLEAQLAELKLKKEVLEGQNKLTQIVNTLQTVGFTGDSLGVFDDIKQAAEEGSRLLDSINEADSWEDKLKIVNEGLAKRTEWIQALTMVKDALSKAEEMAEDAKEAKEAEDDEADEPPETKTKAKKKATKQEAEKDEMDDPEVMERTAKLLQRAVREANVEMVSKLLTALEKKPEVVAKLIMWADERTGANLLHWCGFYGKEEHIALAQTFMMVPGVNASVADKHRNTPCHSACMKNQTDVLEHLITQYKGSTPCDPFAIGSGANCVHLAAKGGYTKMLELLAPRLTIDELERLTSTGKDAISLARTSGHDDVMKIFNKIRFGKKKKSAKASTEL